MQCVIDEFSKVILKFSEVYVIEYDEMGNKEKSVSGIIYIRLLSVETETNCRVARSVCVCDEIALYINDSMNLTIK